MLTLPLKRAYVPARARVNPEGDHPLQTVALEPGVHRGSSRVFPKISAPSPKQNRRRRISHAIVKTTRASLQSQPSATDEVG